MIADALKKNDKCIIVAPSNSVKEADMEVLNAGIKFLESLGLKCSISDNIDSEDYKVKAREIEKAFESDCKLILAARGGNNCEKILKYIDYSKINEKIICGYSDLTSLLNNIYLKTGLITFHGCDTKGFGRTLERVMVPETFEDFKIKFFDNNFIKYPKLTLINNSQNFGGKILGGNLYCFSKLIDLNDDLDLTGVVLFLEDLGYESNKKEILENLEILERAKGFERLSGIIVGNYENLEEEKYKLEDLVKEKYAKYNFNILKGDFFGHSSLNLVIPIGAEIFVENCNIKVTENVLKTLT